MVSSSTDGCRDLQKQIGCVNGVFHLFDRSVAHRCISDSYHKRQPVGVQHQLESHEATKALNEKDQEMQKEKPRVSTESSEASCSSSSGSSTFSSLDQNRKAGAETPALRQSNLSENMSHIRDVVKNSMYREPNGLSVGSRVNDERKVTVTKHLDSPRPSQQSKIGNTTATAYEGSTPVYAQVQEGPTNSKEERLPLPCFSFDGKESRGTFKNTIKLKDFPRLSLDSKASTTKCSALESRLNFLGQDLAMKYKNSNQVLPSEKEPESRTPSSSTIVAKLMGLHSFPDTILTDERRVTKTESSPHPIVAFPSKSFNTAPESKDAQVNFSTPISRKNNASLLPGPDGSSRLRAEPAPWRQQTCSPGSPKIAAQSKKGPTNAPQLSVSVYGEIEERITEIGFKKSRNDLRALKQVLGEIHKTGERVEKQSMSARVTMSSRLEDRCSNLNKASYQHVPTINSTSPYKQLGSPSVTARSPKVMERVKISSSTGIPTMEVPDMKKFQHHDPKCQRQHSACRRYTKDHIPGSNNMEEPSQRLHSNEKKCTQKYIKLEQSSRTNESMRALDCTTSERGSRMVSPRSQKNALRTEGQYHLATRSSSHSGRVIKQHSARNGKEKCSQNRKHATKAMDLHLINEQLSEISSDLKFSSCRGHTTSLKSESNRSIGSQTETDITNQNKSTNNNSRRQQATKSTSKEHAPAVLLTVNIMEQPSPVSVLDSTLYSESSPSPVKKTLGVFQDGIPSSDEAEWHLENQLTDSTRSNSFKCNQKSEPMLPLIHRPQSSNTEPVETAANHYQVVHQSLKLDHGYIKKILLASGLLKDSSIIPRPDRLNPSCYLINPNLFNIIEETEVPVEEANGETVEKNDQMKFNQKIERRIVFDLLNEILVRRITLCELFTVGRSRTNPQRLIEEVYEEIDHLCRLPSCNLADEDDGLFRLFTSDTKYSLDDWTTYSGEIPALALDIERLIFKDLINEVVTGEVMGHHDWLKRHHKLLFTKQYFPPLS